MNGSLLSTPSQPLEVKTSVDACDRVFGKRRLRYPKLEVWFK